MKFVKSFSILLLLLAFLSNAHAKELSVTAVVEKQTVYVGESFALQIQVQGDESPQEPDVSHIKDFQVIPRGGRQNSSESITIINGKVNRISKHGYIFNYSLIPKREGKLVIPSFTVVAGGKTLQSKPIVIAVSKPQETEDFKLRMRLSKQQCYVGEPVTLTVTWYIGKDVEEFSFSFPYLEDPRFTAVPQEHRKIGRQQNILKIPAGKKVLYAQKERGVLNGREYLTVQFSQTLIPQTTGQIRIPQVTVSSKVLQGYNRRRSNDPFDDFFRWNRRGVYSTVITPSNEPQIQVLPLPDTGKPADFNGLVGTYSIFTQASPLEVNVGDPITLTIMITGPEYLGNVKLPPLQQNQDLMTKFKVPDEMAPGEIKGSKKVFTQTIRAQHAEVKAIPALKLSFFDPMAKKYAAVGSEPIPIAVRQTKVVTVMDAEGTGTDAIVRQDIRALKQGIAQNFEDFSILENQEFDRGDKILPLGWLLILVIPPGLFLFIIGASAIIGKRKDDPLVYRAQKAYKHSMNALQKIEQKPDIESSQRYTMLAIAIREYLGNKLGMPAQSVTFQDVESPLVQHGVSPEIIADLKKVMDGFEAHIYAGISVSQAEIDSDINKARDSITEVERAFS